MAGYYEGPAVWEQLHQQRDLPERAGVRVLILKLHRGSELD